MTPAITIATQTGLPLQTVLDALTELERVHLGRRDAERFIYELARQGKDPAAEAKAINDECGIRR
jgi:DNA-binding IclR family transcriptional regulator